MCTFVFYLSLLDLSFVRQTDSNTVYLNSAEVDEERKKMTILSPSPGKLPFIYLIMGNLKWMDT